MDKDEGINVDLAEKRRANTVVTNTYTGSCDAAEGTVDHAVTIFQFLVDVGLSEISHLGGIPELSGYL